MNAPLETAAEHGKFSFVVVDLCPGCRRWVVHPNGMAIKPWLPENLHILPETVGGGFGR